MYRKWVHLWGPRGEKVRMHAVIDGGAMLNTLCMSKWKRQRDQLTPLELSDMILSITDNHKIASEGRWTGIVEVADAQVTQSFKVFDSNGAFEVILGKPWLRSVQAVHCYKTDEITITTKGKMAILTNEPAGQPEVQLDQRQQIVLTTPEEDIGPAEPAAQTGKIREKWRTRAAKDKGTGPAPPEAARRPPAKDEPRVTWPHVTTGTKNETSLHRPRQGRLPDE